MKFFIESLRNSKGTAYVGGPDTNTVLNKQMKSASICRSFLYMVIGQSQSPQAYIIWFGSLYVLTKR